MRRARYAGRLALALAACLALVGLAPQAARAESFESDGGQVTFTAERKLESSFTTEALADLQPGDDVTLTVALANQYAGDTDWYVSNEVLQAFEDSGAAGAAYTYRLTYVGADGAETVVYDSDTVGGDITAGGNAGLHEVSELEDHVYLGTLAQGQGGSVALYVALDGETQGNAYMETLADLQLNFAVEVPEANVVEVTRTVTQTRTVTAPVNTGDATQMLPLFVAMAASGAVLLVLAVGRVRRSQGGDAR